MTFVSHLTCSECGRTHDASALHNLCECGGPLLVEYDLDRVGASVGPEDIATRIPTMWRYRELLPLDDPAGAVTLGEGFTPLLPAPRLGKRIGLPGLRIKDDGPNPTGTFKCRGASSGVSRARELGVTDVALPSSGNAGAAWACYGAAAGMRVHVAMAGDAPPAAVLEARAYGAEVTVVEGSIAEAAAELEPRSGRFDVSTLREPYRVEGKKTLGLEIAEQLGWRWPDAIVYPAGGGVGLIGIWRAVQQIKELGWGAGDPPRLIVVQAEGCAPVVRAFREGRDRPEPWPNPRTVATGLRVPHPLGGALVLRAVRDTGGTAVAVSDRAILEAVGEMARDAGVLPCPEGAATVAGARALRERGDLGEDDVVVTINTGTGLKYPEAVAAATGG